MYGYRAIIFSCCGAYIYLVRGGQNSELVGHLIEACLGRRSFVVAIGQQQTTHLSAGARPASLCYDIVSSAAEGILRRKDLFNKIPTLLSLVGSGGGGGMYSTYEHDATFGGRWFFRGCLAHTSDGRARQHNNNKNKTPSTHTHPFFPLEPTTWVDTHGLQ